MGKTVESYRIALETEIHRWDGFAKALRKEDHEAFEELMDMCRNNHGKPYRLEPTKIFADCHFCFQRANAFLFCAPTHPQQQRKPILQPRLWKKHQTWKTLQSAEAQLKM
jgi:hypothetical protein